MNKIFLSSIYHFFFNPQLLNNSNNWYCDGTLDIAPTLKTFSVYFYQSDYQRNRTYLRLSII
ncbi:hypothetical protein BpHYR1_004657 [Brachionus plicatilis]|uniref:Uncharacterized protein n=1 Tax=Brachionus plicatilis TaxID=10195 RepID=A0A3M7S7B6_BRAPC|nr:hypothetical protein BpHYR1_004657 [Brachionus plicatilis]